MNQSNTPNRAWSPVRTRPSWPAGAEAPASSHAHGSLVALIRGSMGPRPTIRQLLDVVDASQRDPAVAALYSDTALARLTVEELLDVEEAEGSRALELGELIATWMRPSSGQRPRDYNEPLSAFVRAGLDYSLALEEMQASLTPDAGVWICRVGHLNERHPNVATAIRTSYVRWVTPIRERIERFDEQLVAGRGNLDRIESLRLELTERAHAWRLTRFAL
ncbi:MAG: hypothetical protein B7733_10905 [Myxococcales bacterium FL481]|nr:MAG: hypothetical protein B7733_10905 [Myxococcales bacterium FL481]